MSLGIGLKGTRYTFQSVFGNNFLLKPWQSQFFNMMTLEARPVTWKEPRFISLFDIYTFDLWILSSFSTVNCLKWTLKTTWSVGCNCPMVADLAIFSRWACRSLPLLVLLTVSALSLHQLMEVPKCTAITTHYAQHWRNLYQILPTISKSELRSPSESIKWTTEKS